MYHDPLFVKGGRLPACDNTRGAMEPATESSVALLGADTLAPPPKGYFEAVPLTAYNAATALEASADRRLVANLQSNKSRIRAKRRIPRKVSRSSAILIQAVSEVEVAPQGSRESDEFVRLMTAHQGRLFGFVPMSQTWIYGRRPFMTGHNRGPFGAIPTQAPGIRISGLLPRSAAIMNQWSIIRSLHHDNAGHSAADQICFTGYAPGPNADANVAPSCGSIAAKQLQRQNRKLPAYVMIPRNVPGTESAYLGAAYRPFETQADPAQGGSFVVPNLQAPSGLSVERLAGRRRLLGDLDSIRRSVDRSGAMEAMDEFHQKAWDIVTGPEARRAFDLSPPRRGHQGGVP